MREKRNFTMEEMVAYCNQYGFIFQGSEIYGGLANTWDYGPLGTRLKNQIKDAWRYYFIQKRENSYEIDADILMNPKVWEASGHVAGFTDPLLDCKSCKSRHRADTLIENFDIKVKADAMTESEMMMYIREKRVPCPNCGQSDFTDIRQFNLMFATQRGVTNDSSSKENNLRIAVCDDLRIYVDDVIANCKKAFADENLIFDCFSSGEELLASDFKSDFLFLDIEMSGIDGISVKDLLEQRKCETKIIFLTSHEERMVEAFGENVIGFLHKPLQQDAFDKIVSKMKRILNKATVEWEDEGKLYVVYAEDIRYIEAQDKYTYVATSEKKYLVRRTIKEWEELLPKPDFCLVNRSCLIHFKFFDKTRDKINLGEGKTVRISRIHKEAIMAHYMQYVRKKAEEM